MFLRTHTHNSNTRSKCDTNAGLSDVFDRTAIVCRQVQSSRDEPVTESVPSVHKDAHTPTRPHHTHTLPKSCCLSFSLALSLSNGLSLTQTSATTQLVNRCVTFDPSLSTRSPVVSFELTLLHCAGWWLARFCSVDFACVRLPFVVQEQLDTRIVWPTFLLLTGPGG